MMLENARVLAISLGKLAIIGGLSYLVGSTTAKVLLQFPDNHPITVAVVGIFLCTFLYVSMVRR
jgi:uncharacterized membrane protein